MKKFNIGIACATAILCTSCSDTTKVTGTSEEINEIGQNVSSSSMEKLSSSITDVSSSSSSDLSSSSLNDGQTPPQESTLDYYLWQYGLINKVRFDKAVMAFSSSEMVSRAPGIDGGAGATEFDGQGVSKFVQGNIGAVQAFFPKAAEKYADLVEATKNGTNECNLYSFNLYGSEKYAGHVLEYISTDTVKVVDIEAKNCEASTDNQIVRFLFSYCGDVNRDPGIERSTVQSDIEKDKCPASKNDDEWVSIIKASEINSSSSNLETCMNVTADECKQDTPCYIYCTASDPQEAIDCESGKQYTCRNGFWTPSDESFWLTESCDENVEHERTLTIYDNTYKSYSFLDYFCIEGKWIERFRYYECGTDPDCEQKHVDMAACQADPIVGTSCDEKSESRGYVSKGDCEYRCNDGVYEYLPPPVY